MGPLAGDRLGGAVYLDIDIQLLGQSYWEPKKLGGGGGGVGGREGGREGGGVRGRKGEREGE